MIYPASTTRCCSTLHETSFAKSESECEPASRGLTTNGDPEQSADEDADLLGDQLVLGDGEYEEVLRDGAQPGPIEAESPAPPCDGVDVIRRQ